MLDRANSEDITCVWSSFFSSFRFYFHCSTESIVFKKKEKKKERIGEITVRQPLVLISTVTNPNLMCSRLV
jgi:hypothetical protein